MIIKVPLLKERFIALPILARLNPKTNIEEKQRRSKAKSKSKTKGKSEAKG